MARSGKSRFTTSGRMRVAPVNATPRVHPLSLSRLLSAPPVAPILIEDRRTYHPDGLFRPPGSLTRAARQLVIGKPKSAAGRFKFKGFSPTVTFKEPSKVAVCHRRKTRREVLFAKGVGGGKVRKGKRNYLSQFSC